MGHVNVIWQGDANAQVLRALRTARRRRRRSMSAAPRPSACAALAEAFGERFGKTPAFTGEEAPIGWLVNTGEATRLFGYPVVPLSRMIEWVEDWVERDLPTFNKPTQYESRSGPFHRQSAGGGRPALTLEQR